jgi:hypothetical protein
MNEYFVFADRRFVLTSMPTVDASFAWDDQNPDYDYQSRTLRMPDPPGPSYNAPAVLRYYPLMRERAGDYIVDLEDDPVWRWAETVTMLNSGDAQKFGYWKGSARAQFNNGWPKLSYVGMSGNAIKVVDRIGSWVKFETLKPTDWLRARSMTVATHPEVIHNFTCITWDGEKTKRINSTGTPRGMVVYPLITNEGFAYIPARHVVRAA